MILINNFHFFKLNLALYNAPKNEKANTPFPNLNLEFGCELCASYFILTKAAQIFLVSEVGMPFGISHQTL